MVGWALVSLAAALMLTKGLEFSIQLAVVAGILAILAVSLNLIIGYTGLLSVAQIGFFAIGAYVTAILTRNPPPGLISGEAGFPVLAWDFFAVLPIAMVISGLVALLMGIVFSRLRDDYFALATLGFAVIIHRTVTSARYFTRGALGVNYVPSPSIGPWTLDEPWEHLLMVWVCLAIIAALSWYIVNTSFGRVLTAIREDEDAVEVFGYRAAHFKLAIFVVSGMMAAVAGALFAGYIGFISPNDFILLESLIITAIVLVGGLASISGSILAAVVWILLEDGLRFVPGLGPALAGQVRIGLLGVVLVVVMLFKPQGLVGRYKL